MCNLYIKVVSSCFFSNYERFAETLPEGVSFCGVGFKFILLLFFCLFLSGRLLCIVLKLFSMARVETSSKVDQSYLSKNKSHLQNADEMRSSEKEVLL